MQVSIVKSLQPNLALAFAWENIRHMVQGPPPSASGLDDELGEVYPVRTEDEIKISVEVRGPIGPNHLHSSFLNTHCTHLPGHSFLTRSSYPSYNGNVRIVSTSLYFRYPNLPHI